MTHAEATQRFYTHVWPHRAAVLRAARFTTTNPAEADDLAQETLMRAFRKIDQLDPSSNPAAWLTTILRHAHIDRTRVRSAALLSDAREIRTDVVDPQDAPPAEHDLRDPQQLLEQFSDKAVIDALHRLPEDLRWTLVIVDVEQTSYEDAAAILEVPEGTVKSRVHRGRRMLRDALLAIKPETVGQKSQWRTP